MSIRCCSAAPSRCSPRTSACCSAWAQWSVFPSFGSGGALRAFAARGRGSARQALGAYVGAAADNLVYLPNVTMGLNIVARALDLGPAGESRNRRVG